MINGLILRLIAAVINTNQLWHTAQTYIDIINEFRYYLLFMAFAYLAVYNQQNFTMRPF